MAVLTSWTFWLLVGTIIVIITLIGYLAEGTDLVKKQKKSKLKQKTQPEPVQEISTPPIVVGGSKIPVGVSVVTSDGPVEILNIKDVLWSDDAPKPDPTQTTIHNVSSIDDWTSMPEITPSEKSEEKSAKPEENDQMFPDITIEDFEKPTETNKSEINGIWS